MKTPPFPKVRRLPASLRPITDASLDGAACKGHAPLFDLTVHGETSEQREARHHQARNLCRRCPVFTQCTTVAGQLKHDHKQGFWAGMLLGNNKEN
ncbi:WhiB family transcriptional regulator [uncultured Corynebacterium sp.]|uniref:WhiB family transcriptional regulator n=1 Tax=uncultured Corynebacterium sp. TaxID=159447 RepID=UPI00338F8D31